MQEQVSSPQPSEVDTLERLRAYVDIEKRECLCQGRTLEGSLSWPRPRPKWVGTADVLLTPERELTQRGREVKERWQALIAEARDITELELAVEKTAGITGTGRVRAGREKRANPVSPMTMLTGKRNHYPRKPPPFGR